MTSAVARIVTLVSRSRAVFPSPAITATLKWATVEFPTSLSTISSTGHLQLFSSMSHKRSFHISHPYARHPMPPLVFLAAFLRCFRNVRWRQAARKQTLEEKKLELRVKISTEDRMSDDHEIVNIVEMLKLDVPMAMKITFDSLKELECRTQNFITEDICRYEKIELSILLCSDELISKLNKEYKGSNCCTSFLSIIHHERELPILMLGDIAISIEAATRQALGRGLTLLEEIRLLMVRGLLQLVGFDNMCNDTSTEVEELEDLVLGRLDWKVRPKMMMQDVVPYAFRS